MAEKILNINDFKKDEAGIDNKAGVPSKTAPLRTPYVRLISLSSPQLTVR